MKRIIPLVFLLILSLFLCACSGKNSTPEIESNKAAALPTEIKISIKETIADDNEIIDTDLFLGTWQLSSMVIGDSTFTFDELVDLGIAKEEERESLIFVFQEGGKVYNGASGKTLNWSVSNGIIILGTAECQYTNGILSIPSSEYIFNMEKVSSNQEIGDHIEDTQQNNTQSSGEVTDGIRPGFKEAMDAYEAFYDEYCSFMEQYMENPTDMNLLFKYTEMLTKLNEMDESFKSWDQSEMTNEELKYYLDVNNRVMQKLLDVTN